MADKVWFEVPGYTHDAPNREAAVQIAREAAEHTERTVEVYQVTRKLVRTFQRKITITETDVPTA